MSEVPRKVYSEKVDGGDKMPVRKFRISSSHIIRTRRNPVKEEVRTALSSVTNVSRQKGAMGSAGWVTVDTNVESISWQIKNKDAEALVSAIESGRS